MLYVAFNATFKKAQFAVLLHSLQISSGISSGYFTPGSHLSLACIFCRELSRVISEEWLHPCLHPSPELSQGAVCVREGPRDVGQGQ